MKFEEPHKQDSEDLDTLLDRMNSLDKKDFEYEKKLGAIKKKLIDLVESNKNSAEEGGLVDDSSWEDTLADIKNKADELLPEHKIDELVDEIKNYLPMLKSAARDRILANDGEGAKKLSSIYNEIIEEFKNFLEVQADITQERLIAFNEWFKEIKVKAEKIISGEEEK